MTGAGRITIARVHDPEAKPQARSGAGLLVDRVWPRGIRKADLEPDAWLREIAPSTELRKWFGHVPARWDEFRRRYLAELEDNPDAVERCLDWCRKGPVTLLYGARDRDHNQAVVLADHLARRLEKGAGSKG